MAISQGSNLINVVVHNSADSRDASLSAIILSHVHIEGKKHCLPTAQTSFLLLVLQREREREAGYRLQTGGEKEEGDIS